MEQEYRYLKFTRDGITHCDRVFEKGAIVAIPIELSDNSEDLNRLIDRGLAEWLTERPKTKKNILTLTPLGENVVHIRKEVLLKNQPELVGAVETITDPFTHALDGKENANE